MSPGRLLRRLIASQQVENMSGLDVDVDSVTFISKTGEDVTARVQSALANALPLTSLRAHVNVFGSGGGGAAAMAAAWGVPFLGRVPLDPALTAAGDAGVCIPPTALASPAVCSIIRLLAQELATPLVR